MQGVPQEHDSPACGTADRRGILRLGGLESAFGLAFKAPSLRYQSRRCTRLLPSRKFRGEAEKNQRIDPDGAFGNDHQAMRQMRLWPGTGPLAGGLLAAGAPARPDPGGQRPRRGALGPWRLADPLRHPAGRPGRAMRPDPERGSRGPLQRRPHRDRAEDRRPEEQADAGGGAAWACCCPPALA